MSKINSRAKGCRGERQWRDKLHEFGFTSARRGQQFSGSKDSPDVVCEQLSELHWEVKNVESGNPYNWMDQAVHDADNSKTPIVAHKRNGRDWLCIMRAEDLLQFLARLYPVAG